MAKWLSKYFDKSGKQFSLLDFSFEPLRLFLGGIFVLSGTIKVFNQLALLVLIHRLKIGIVKVFFNT